MLYTQHLLHAWVWVRVMRERERDPSSVFPVNVFIFLGGGVGFIVRIGHLRIEGVVCCTHF